MIVYYRDQSEVVVPHLTLHIPCSWYNVK